MLRFYTPADDRKSFFDLYRIQSVRDYVNSISGLRIDWDELKAQTRIHPDYEFAGNYLDSLIEKCARVCFLAVYDLSKEAYFIKKYPRKHFLVCDVSDVALKNAVSVFQNIQVCETTLDDFKAESDDLIVINIAEYFMTRKQLAGLVRRGGAVVLSNVHFYVPGWRWRLHSAARETQIFCLNILSMMTGGRQFQFRGWWRTDEDFVAAAEGSGKYVKAIMFNKQRSRDSRFGTIHSALIHYERI